MIASGQVLRKNVIDVLRRHRVEVCHPRSKPDIFVLAKGDHIESVEIPERVGRRMLQYLQRKYAVPIYHFYHPSEAPQLPEESVQ